MACRTYSAPSGGVLRECLNCGEFPEAHAEIKFHGPVLTQEELDALKPGEITYLGEPPEADTTYDVMMELLLRLVKEAAELQQAATRAMLYGLGSTYNDGRTNLEQIHIEVADVKSVLSLMQNHPSFHFVHVQWERLMEAKLMKVSRYARTAWVKTESEEHARILAAHIQRGGNRDE